MSSQRQRSSGPLRVLQSFAGLGRGGAEQLAMNWYRSIDRSRIQFDFVAEDRGRPYEHVEEIERLGGRVFLVPRCGPGNVLTYIQAWRTLLTEHPEWSIVHAHHTTPAPIYLTVARSLKRTCIAHSHNTDRQLSIKALARRALGRPLNVIAHVRLACGDEAGRAMFGRGRFTVVPNSIDVSDFAFSSGSREQVRADLGCDDRLVVGHVGRFTEVKNHRQIIQIFAQLLRRSPGAKLLLVGDGPLRGEIEDDVRARGLVDDVVFAGSRADVNRLMSAMDVFLLPSLYEGLPVTLVEAQANGLPAVISDTITDEVRLTPLIRAVALSASTDEWVEAILGASAPSGRDRIAYADELRGTEYDVAAGTARISTLYERLAHS